MIGSRFLAAALSLLLLVSLKAEILVPSSSTGWKYVKGFSEASSPDITAWRHLSFNDTVWAPGTTPFYYGESVNGGTLLSDMRNNYSSVFLRRKFTITDLTLIAAADLDVRSDDGFVAWVNGQQVGSINAPATVTYDAVASAGAPEPSVFSTFSIPLSALQQGQNVVAIQFFNVSLTGSSDAYLDAQIVTKEKETIAPTVLQVTPASGSFTNLTQITVNFSESVLGVNASDLRVNDVAATSVTGSGANYTFHFTQPAFGDVLVTWSIDANITDTAVPPNPFDPAHPTSTFAYKLIDPSEPMIAATHPPRGLTVNQLSEIDVHFNKAVTGVNASDLLVNGQTATNVVGFAAGPYRFSFPPQADGPVAVTWAANHEIQDENVPPRAFAATSWNYTVNTTQPAPKVRINEIMAANESGMLDQFGAAEDWIELYNDESFPVSLEGWSLTDDETKRDQWIFPRITIGAKSCLVVFASGRGIRDAAAPRLHTNFKLSLPGEYLGLYSPEAPRRVVSEFRPKYPEQRNDFSYGVSESGEWRYFSGGTPGVANGNSTIAQVVGPVHFSVERGYYNGPFQLSLHSPTPGAVVRYTFDGREPTETVGTNYTTPLIIDRTRMVRAAAFKTGALPSTTRTHTYLFNIPISRMRLPAMSLVTASNHLYGATGIMEVNPRNTTMHGMAWERPVSVELIRPEDNGGFQIDCGIRIQGGGYIRGLYDYRTTELPRSKYSYRLYFRGDYGQGKLDYKLFPDIPLEEFDEVVLRAGMNDHSNPFIRDEMTRLLSADVGQVASHGTFVHMFLNGVYKGIYNPTERIAPKFLQAWHGGSENWDVIAQSGEISEGDAVEWNQLRNLAATQNPASTAVYQQIEERLDLDNFIDYLLVNIYAGTTDWPWNNWRAARENALGSKFRFYVWDAEWSFGFNNAVTHNTILNELSGASEIPTLFNRLRLSPEFRLRFADRAHKHFYNAGALTDEKIRARYESLRAQVASSISGFNNVMSTTWIAGRRRNVTNHIAAAGLMLSSNAPTFNLAAGRIPNDVPLTMATTDGDIWFTTNGVDPRVPFTGAIHPQAVRYTTPIQLTATTLVKARALSGTRWSALTEATYLLDQLGVPIRITEIMYNPPGGDAYEFIEIQNIGPKSIDLGGFTFEGVTYRFPQNVSSLAAGQRWVLASSLNPPAFAQRYPQVQVYGNFTGTLSNGGETLVLRDAAGNVVTMVAYDDENGWPTGADGLGESLEFIDPSGDASSVSNWKSSGGAGGTPGAANSAGTTVGSVRLNELFALGNPTNTVSSSDWVEIYNAGSTTVNLTGWSLTDDSNPRRFVFPAGTQIAAGAYLQVFCDSLSTPSGLHAGFALNAEGETVFLYDANTNRVDGVTYGIQLPTHSIGRGESSVGWTLNEATPGARNEEVSLSTDLVINEVFPNPLPGQDDWLELHNANTNLPAGIGGYYVAVSNNISRLPELSFVRPGGFVQIFANEEYGPNQVHMKLPAVGATVVLYDGLGAELNRLTYGAIREGVSTGRLPDGSNTMMQFPASPSPAAPNYLPNISAVQLNEVMAIGTPDWIELHNPLPEAVDLGGMSLSINERDPRQWSFAAGTMLAAGGYLQVQCDGLRPVSTGGASGFNTGRAIDDSGSGVFLYDRFGQVVDFVEFGAQVPGMSIGRSGGFWNLLGSNSPGIENREAALMGDANQVKINEWMAGPLSGDDWFELYNPELHPINVGGFYVTDDPSMSGRTNTQLAELTFIAPRGFILLQADGEIDKGADHVGFSLDIFGETLRLYNGVIKVDELALLVQAVGVSEGRYPDGSSSITQFPGAATPAAPNAGPMLDSDGDGLPDAWEDTYGLNRLSASDALLDVDSDGMSNLDEYRAGTNPTNAASRFTLQIERQESGRPLLIFNAATGKSYTILASDIIDAAAWNRVGNILPGVERQVELVDDDEGVQTRFYRIMSPMQP